MNPIELDLEAFPHCELSVRPADDSLSCEVPFVLVEDGGKQQVFMRTNGSYCYLNGLIAAAALKNTGFGGRITWNWETRKAKVEAPHPAWIDEGQVNALRWRHRRSRAVTDLLGKISAQLKAIEVPDTVEA